MFASTQTFKYSLRLILFSALLCAAPLQAQQTAEATDQPAIQPADNPGSATNRRIERLGEASTDEWEMDLALPAADSISPSANAGLILPDEEQNQSLQQLLSSLAANPGDTGVLGQLNVLLTSVMNQATDLMDDGSFDLAGQLLMIIQSINPDLEGFDAAMKRLQDFNAANELLIAGNTALHSQRILEPDNNNALYYFNQVLSNNPHSQPAQDGLAKVQLALVELALASARELDFELAEEWLLEASAVREDQEVVEGARVELANFERAHASELEKNAVEAMDAGNFDLADFRIIDLIAFGGQEARVISLRERLKEARLYGGFEPGQVIRDELLISGGQAPEIVVISAGSFLMGSRPRSGSNHDNEKPQHRVTIELGFGLGVREVTVEEFRLFIKRSGYRTAAERSGRSRVYNESAGRLNNREGIDWEYDYRGKKAKPNMPVLHVNAHDAEAYVAWLAHETGKNYRLPSEAEYEYVARAGGGGPYWWGEGSPAKMVENLTGDRDSSSSNRRWTSSFKRYGDGHWGPAVSGSLTDDELVHPMGVYDIAGNVCEWTQDCWHQNYVKAPTDGSAWINPGCSRRVVRGGYWASSPEQSRAAYRVSAKAETYGSVVGIRIARDL